ncbi:sigma-54-dependent Fis family transcriptional regulator [bacterium]|nr:sigma-54-dependent Fis family transcriptional regulator [bacterium]MCB9476588.1 sigma-54-dependent Fis family transcriptional regulator [Deltaproteobacteria bacterium]
MAKILVIDDNETMREGMQTIIARMGHEALAAGSGTEGVALFEKGGVDVVLTDLKMEGMDGIEVLTACKAINEACIVVVITAFGTIEVAVEAIKKGAFDFIQKPFSQDVLRLKISQALEFSQLARSKELLEEENRYLREDRDREYAIDQMIGESDALKDILKTVEKVAKGDSTVYIHGESGVGKELIARAVHEQSHRKGGPFITVNCSALAEGVMESELFGHEKGSFTGAVRKKLGRFELADKGTLFLDEIGDISPLIQLKLLRVLQEREFERVGGQSTIHVDVRIICATNKDLKEEVAKGNFREDLFYRLHIVPINVPPLRERREDIPLLADHFLGKLTSRTRQEITKIAPDAIKALSEYHWPGNIRELENVIEQSMVLCEGATIDKDDLPSFITNEQAVPNLRTQLGKRPLNEILEDLERSLIKEAYERSGRVKTETAKLLGIKTSALYYKLEKYGLISN